MDNETNGEACRACSQQDDCEHAKTVEVADIEDCKAELATLKARTR